MVDDPNGTVICDPPSCTGCGASLVGAPVSGVRRHQVFDAPSPPRPHVAEHRVVTRTCGGCGTGTVGDAPAGTAGRVRYGPGLAARAAWLICAHHLPVRRAGRVLAALLAPAVSTGWVAAVRGRAARSKPRSYPMPRS